MLHVYYSALYLALPPTPLALLLLPFPSEMVVPCGPAWPDGEAY